jgi:hypothetical protein
MRDALMQQCQTEVLPVCQRYGVGVIPYSPLAGGRLSANTATATPRYRCASPANGWPTDSTCHCRPGWRQYTAHRRPVDIGPGAPSSASITPDGSARDCQPHEVSAEAYSHVVALDPGGVTVRTYGPPPDELRPAWRATQDMATPSGGIHVDVPRPANCDSHDSVAGFDLNPARSTFLHAVMRSQRRRERARPTEALRSLASPAGKEK